MAALFGKPRTGGFGEMYPAPAPQQQAAPRRRGIFGRLGNWASRQDWERMGAALQGPEVLSDLMAGRRQEQMMAAQMAQQQYARGRENMADKRQLNESAQEQAQMAQIEAIISSLPPDQQALARLDPNGYVSGMMRHRFPAPRGADGGQTDPDGWVYEP